MDWPKGPARADVIVLIGEALHTPPGAPPVILQITLVIMLADSLISWPTASPVEISLKILVQFLFWIVVGFPIRDPLRTYLLLKSTKGKLLPFTDDQMVE